MWVGYELKVVGLGICRTIFMSCFIMIFFNGIGTKISLSIADSLSLLPAIALNIVFSVLCSLCH